MTHMRTMLASVAVLALTVGITSRADLPSEPETPPAPDYLIIATDTAPAAGQTDESAEDSAKMGGEESTDGARLGETTETESDKIDQPRDQDRTAGDASGDAHSTHQ